MIKTCDVVWHKDPQTRAWALINAVNFTLTRDTIVKFIIVGEIQQIPQIFENVNIYEALSISKNAPYFTRPDLDNFAVGSLLLK